MDNVSYPSAKLIANSPSSNCAAVGSFGNPFSITALFLCEILLIFTGIINYRIKFIKRRKYKPLGAYIPGVEFLGDRNPIHMIEGVEFMEDGYDFNHWYNTLKEIDEINKNNAVNIEAVSFVDDYQYKDNEEIKFEED
jgi:hypothetical protein